MVDPRAGTAIEGPDLPGEHRTLVVPNGRAVLLHGYIDEPSMPATVSVFNGERRTPHRPPAGLFDAKHGMMFAPLCSLRDGRVLMHAWRSMAIVLFDIDAMTMNPLRHRSSHVRAASAGVLARVRAYEVPVNSQLRSMGVLPTRDRVSSEPNDPTVEQDRVDA